MVGPQKYRLGLALGSGAARGWAHIGALRALDDLGVRPDVVCGTSMGALVGGFYLSGHLAALEEWARSLTRLKVLRFMDISLNGSGLVRGKRLLSEMERVLGDLQVDELDRPFATVVTDLATGHETWLTEGRLIDAIRASFSLPAFFEPVMVQDRWVIDGALVNPVPVSVCHALGAQVVIAINLNVTTPTRKGRAPAPANGAHGMGVSAGLLETVLRGGRSGMPGSETGQNGNGNGMPSRIGVMAATLNIVQDRVTRSRLAADPPDVNIVPRVSNIGLLDLHTAADAIDAGKAAVYESESVIRDALQLFEVA